MWKGPLILTALLALIVAGSPSAPPPAMAQSDSGPSPLPVIFVADDFPARRILPQKPQGPPKPLDTSLRIGSRGEAVMQLEQKLASLGYLVGKVDGVFDKATYFGVVAFQKVEHLARHGKGDAPTLHRVDVAQRPTPAYTTPPTHLEIDIPRQIVFVVREGAVSAVLPTSTGSNKLFTAQGWTRRAITPNGVFKITRKIAAMRISPLGQLYKPSYFNGGIAFHGNPSVPVFPASHGCVRLPMQFADWFFHSASPVGTVVYVYGGPTGPNPQPYIDDRPAASPQPSPTPESSGTPSPTPSDTPSSITTPTAPSTP